MLSCPTDSSKWLFCMLNWCPTPCSLPWFYNEQEVKGVSAFVGCLIHVPPLQTTLALVINSMK
ncbi:hypothetical protein BOTBODRAFT_295432 [Botryobasidium botryosum FD-172 SS1]|uniref:Uncharacterized protein n=1 Tax=Botryobasidium botryosum (strain FD-172 SS1) TaxID=930990 RepID=A0A067MHZ8_BOTB1|nr:hypothetical protein BOTBODRAFT_295432 [Botryobasidium botryosum FD-172 SS1]